MIQGIGPRLEAKLSIPDVIRPGRKYALHIEYENTGDADLIAPFLTIRGSEKTMIGLSPDQDLETIPLQLLAISSEGPSGVLPPGSKGTIPIYFQPPFMNQIEFQLDVLTDFEKEINWDEMYPAYADSIREQIGSTWGDFHRALAAEATELWRKEIPTYDISLLRKRLMDRIFLKPSGEISGIVVNNQYEHPQSNLTVLLTSVSEEEYSIILESTTDSEGRFHFKNAPADTYTIQCVGYATVTPEQITLLENEILHDLVLQVPYGGVIEGTVFQSTNRAPIENVYIQLQGPNETSYSTVTNEKGVYRFSSLEPGQYSVQATATAFASIRHEGIQLWASQVIREVDFLLKEGLSLTGAVKDAITENRIPNPIVTAKNSVGLQFVAQTSEDGSYVFTDLAEGIYSLQCFAQGYQMKEQKEIQLAASDSTSIDFVLSPAVSTQGQVLSKINNESIANATVSFFNLISQTGNSTMTDSNGNFTIPQLTPGIHYIWVEAYGYLTCYKLSQIDESTQDQSIQILLDKGSAIQGHVYDADGNTVSDCIVYVENENEVEIASVKTVDGAYQLDAIPQGIIKISAIHEEHTFPVHSITLDSNDAQLDFIALQHRLVGRIINGSTTQTMTETIISAIPVMSQRDQNQGIAVLAADDGTYEMPSLSQGEYLVSAESLLFGRETKTIQITDEVQTVDFTLFDEKTIQGEIRSQQTGVPIPGAMIRFKRSIDDPGVWCLSNESGVFQCDRLAVGTYEVHAQADGYPYFILPDVVITNAEQVEPLLLTLPETGIIMLGTIFDDESSLPIPNAVIQYELHGHEIVQYETSEDGTYRTNPLAPGAYTITIQFGNHVFKESYIITDQLNTIEKDWLIHLYPTRAAYENEINPISAILGSEFINSLMAKNDVTRFPTLKHDLTNRKYFLFIPPPDPYAYPKEWEDLKSTHPKLQRNPRVEEMMRRMGGQDKWFEALKSMENNPYALENPCNRHFINATSFLIRSEEAYKNAWKASNAHSQASIAGWGETVSEALVLAGKIADLNLKYLKVLKTIGEKSKLIEQLAKADNLKKKKDVLAFIKDAYSLYNTVSNSRGKGWEATLKVLWFELKQIVKSDHFKSVMENQGDLGLVLGPIADPFVATLDILYQQYKIVKAYIDVTENLKQTEKAVTNAYGQYHLNVQRAWSSFQLTLDCEENPEGMNNPPLHPLVTEESTVVMPKDPNEKMGPGGMEGTIPADDVIVYTIFFENMPEASASAQEVRITDDLSDLFDWNTIQFHEIAFGDRVISIPEKSASYEKRITYNEYALDLSASLNRFTGRVRWTLVLIDPETGSMPIDSSAGFLPPNNPEIGDGEGHVTFSIQLTPDLPAGTQIKNSASIVFDANEPIETNETIHTIGDPVPEQPIPSFPSNESVYQSQITLEASSYYHPMNVEHAASQFEISSFTYDVLTWDSGIVSAVTQYQVPENILENDQLYQWRVRYQGANQQWSSWSEKSWFRIYTELLPQDLNQDGIINKYDIFSLQNNWHLQGLGDINQDGIVDTIDLIRFINQ